MGEWTQATRSSSVRSQLYGMTASCQWERRHTASTWAQPVVVLLQL